MKHPFFLASCAVIFAATLRAQTLDPDGAVESFKSRFEAAKSIPQDAPAAEAPAAAAQPAPSKLALHCDYSKKDDFYSAEYGGFANDDKKGYEATFQPTADGTGWTVSSSETVDGKPMRISVTTADAFAHVKALGWWGTAGKSRVFTPRDGKIEGYRFVVSFKAPNAPRSPSCVIIACGVDVEPASTTGKTCD
ncbi:MAG TPA: hypothetical protein VN915_05915 [Elusimicrobiota bacterium]|nr:hypothetical protein [Elusimicrobiota bacterium]